MRPRIVGLFHGALYSEIGAPKRKSHVLREFKRATGRLAKLPRGTRVGVEISPRELRLFTKRPRKAPFDALVMTALLARKLGHKVVPLDSNAASLRHNLSLAEAADVRHAVLRQLTQPAQMEVISGVAFQRYMTAVRRDYLISRLRSIAVGKRLLSERLPVAFLGETHLHDLKPLLKDTHYFHHTPEPVARQLLANHERVVRRSWPALRARLDAHTRKRLRPAVRAFRREERK
jgi:hypothetical protein